MKKKTVQLMAKLVSVLLVFALMISYVPAYTAAVEIDGDQFIVVSLGDSYSAGEGIPDFYGPVRESDESEESFWNRRIADNDFMAHRSPGSWPAQLKFSDVSGTMANYKVEDGATSTADVQWYFVAASGAVSKEIYESKQEKKYRQTVLDLAGDRGDKKVLSGSVYLPVQLDVFDRIDKNDVDYVTMTIGGNDLGFAKVVETAAKKSTWLGSTALEKMLNERWNNIDSYLEVIEDTYNKVAEKAPNAEIIVVGYPRLFENSGRGWLISEVEAKSVNQKVSMFNDKLEELIDSLDDTLRIHFVSVEESFAGHEAYASNAWINKIYISAKEDDLNEDDPSSHSMHPNAAGAEAYAECVNAKIAEIENAGTLSGKICKASDRTTPVSNATIHIIKDGSTRTLTPDSNGNYSIDLPVGTYLVKVTADGYIEFNAFATIESRQEVFMETFLMVEGEESDIGEAIGTITNALTGNGVEGVTLDVRSGWNNSDSGDILTTVTTNASGDYTVTLPIGNYTLCASKAGYISTTINVVVQPDVCTTKNASMTPIITGDNFRFVLTWGSSPSDLDSHVVGTLSSGNSFHVYFGDKSEYDGDIEVCNLDVDDTTSYGPETITLNAVTTEPYYYYIYNYSSSTGMITSEAQIKVYQGETLVATFNVPTNQADARYWNVFAIVNGELIVNNTITSSADLSYAASRSGARKASVELSIDVEADMLATPKDTVNNSN